ncbi:gliding motility-associated C-terminal domain-containing protein [Flavobacterium gillisiae]|uniref:Gliding motility-associated C-terminal domain-containing protein n=1 Tax=Flavobacterium gillisiae TaxID=150146 RepID=A0A1H4DTE6_9FLAO|nr:T9SS type B sorting domain-containing protein [Flavobacterium gillisiae]SEA75856.1 gliding motility-associated C-terminal domain-containing protein [Flavobacterium gillisiae]
MTSFFNKKSSKVPFLFLILLYSFLANGQDFQWARQIGDRGTDESTAIEVDQEGNSYVIGEFDSNSFDLNPTTTGSQIINNSFSQYSQISDIYLIKQNENGDFLWGKTFGDIKRDQYAYEIKIGNDGNIYLFLRIMYSITNSTFDSFTTIVKLAPNGNELSRIKIKNPDGFFTNGFDIDNQNNFIISGWFTNSKQIDFNNTSVNFQSNQLASFILKLDNTGNFLWQKTFEYPSLATSEIHAKSNGNIIAIQNGVEEGHLLIRILNIDSQNGSVVWEKKLTDQSATTFQLDRLQNIVIAGKNIYQGTADVDPSNNTVSVTSQNYILWLNSNGSFLDVKEYNVREYQDELDMNKIQSDVHNNIYVVGRFSGKIDADPSPNEFFIENPRGRTQYGDGFLIKFDSNRNFDNAFSLESDYRLVIKDLKVQNENIYLMGDFNSNCDLDPSIEVAPFSSLNGGIVLSTDGFIVKLGPCNSSKVVGLTNQSFCSDLNPTVSSISPNSSSVLWYDSAISTTPLSNTTLLSDNKKYYAARKNGNCPESTERLEITAHISSSPKEPMLLSPEFCLSENAKLSEINILGQNIKWYTNLTDLSSIPITTLLQNATTYYVSQTVNGCESGRSPIPVIVHNTAPPTTTSPQTFCIQQNTTLSTIVISGQNIKWYDALTNGNILPNTTALQNGITYYASQTINSCESKRIPILINIVNTTVPIGISPQTFCSSQNPTLATIIISGTAIRWYDNAINGNFLPSSTPLKDGITYYASQTENSCESPNRLALKIQLINTLPASNYEELLCDDLNDGKETVDLTAYNSNLISNTAGYLFAYYNTLSGAEKESAVNKIINTSKFSLNLGANIIYVRINSNTPCYAIAVLKLSVVAKPLILIPDIVPICENNTITINAGSATESFLWSTGATTPSITVANPGEYAVTVTKNYGTISCSSSKRFSVKKSTIATITSIKTLDWTDKNNVITVYVSGAGDFEYSIDGTHYQDSNEFQNLNSGAYTVFVRDKNGCGIVTDKVYLLMYPKFFTPNGDGYNDTWSIHFSDTEIGLTVQLFDRYGKLITVLNQNQTWDGTFNGLELPSTDYWFIVTRADGKEYKGHFTLKR